MTVRIANFALENSLTEIPIKSVADLAEQYILNRNLRLDPNTIVDKVRGKREIFSVNAEHGTLAFRHRTFAEFFFAEGQMSQRDMVIAEDIYDPYWATACFFWMGLQRDCPEIVRAVDAIAFTNRENIFFKMVNHGNLLLAAYLTPYDVVGDSVRKAVEQAVDLYEGILAGQVETLLRALTPIQLLCVFTKILSDSFGYEHFKKCLAAMAEDVYLEDDSSRKLNTLYFVNSILMTIDSKTAFDTMLKDYGSQIPHALQVGIIEHAEERKASTAVLRKMNKDFQKKCRNNLNFRKAIEVAHSKPIDPNVRNEFVRSQSKR